MNSLNHKRNIFIFLKLAFFNAIIGTCLKVKIGSLDKLYCMESRWYFSLSNLSLLLVFVLSYSGQAARAASVSFVGFEEGSPANGYSVQNWSNPGVSKVYDLGGSEKYGSSGYYQIRPTLDSSPSNVSESVSAGNNLGITAESNPTFYSAPIFLNTNGVTGRAGNFVNFGGYSIYRGPDGSTLYRIGGLSVSVSNGPFDTPSGNNSGYFGEAFSFTMSSEMGADFRLGVAVDSVGSDTYAPDYVTLYNPSIGSTCSTNLPRNGSADMVFFDVSAEAGETFSAAVWRLASTNTNVAAISMITFDVSRYKFNVASGQTNASAMILSGAPAALVKLGDGNLVLTNANTYGGDTRVDGGRLVIVHRDALGGTSNGTVVASGAQLRMNTLAETIFAAEPLTLSGDGLAGSVGGALRNAANNNTWKGKITLAADATIGAASGTTLTLDVDSGEALDLAGFNLGIDGGGTVQINDALAGSGQISKTGSGELLIHRPDFTATIKSNSVVVAFSSPPVEGTTHDVLPGPLNDASLVTRNVTGLASDTTWTLTNNPNLQVVVTSGTTNQKPVVDGGQSFTILENSSFGTLVGTLTATDGDGNELSGWTIVSGNEDNVFALDPDTGALSVAGIVDYEIAGSLTHTLTVSVFDGTETSEIATVTVLVGNVAEFSDVFGSEDPASDLDGDGISNLMAYALGAAGSNAPVARPTVALSNGSLVLTAIVRTDDPKLTVVGEAVTNLDNYASGTSIDEVRGEEAADQDGVPDGCMRMTFSVAIEGSVAKKFLRLKASLAQ